MSYKLSIVSCIAEKTACFVFITRSGPCLYLAEFFRICSDPFVTDDVAEEVNRLLSESALASFQLEVCALHTNESAVEPF